MSTYEVIQMHDAQDSSKLQFPKVPLEALIEDVNHLTTPYGIPARVTELLALSATAPTPTKAGQHYYNTATHKIHTSETSGATFTWDAGQEPQAGILYKVPQQSGSSDTLYVKSIDALGIGLHAIGVYQYNGPFWCAGVKSGTTWVVAVESGNVYAGWKEYTVARNTSGITLEAGQTLYLVGTNGSTDATFQYTTNASVTGDMRVRIAYNNAGNLVQCQYGDIQTNALT